MKYFLHLCLAMLPILGFAQEIPPVIDDSGYFIIVEKMPEFPGGEEAYLEYVQRNYNHPTIASLNSIEGVISFNFILDTLGNVGNVKILKGLCKPCDQEAKRVVRSMPRWKPGTQRDKPVRVQISGKIRIIINSLPASYHKAVKYYDEGEYYKAMKMYKGLVSRHPDIAAYWHGLAMMYIKLGSDGLACDAWKKIKHLNLYGREDPVRKHCK
ncbi:MAG: energy transducer TonB [Bacteroidetes bacterium]|nr:energy transducer TonB [Bacteroidota bacterium]